MCVIFSVTISHSLFFSKLMFFHLLLSFVKQFKHSHSFRPTERRFPGDVLFLQIKQMTRGILPN